VEVNERKARGRHGAAPDAQAARRTAARDLGLLRLRKLTRAAVLGATALVGVFAFVAAKAVPGHKLHASSTRTTSSSGGGSANPSASSAAPTLSPSSAAPSLSPPASPPALSSQPPVVVSGGS
jgi:cytoskeletal protein RodZ